MRTLYKKLRYGFNIDDPMSYVGKPRPHGVARWSIRSYTDINKAIARACADKSGRTFYVTPMDGESKIRTKVLIVDNVWRAAYNKRVRKASRISGVKMKNEALFIAVGGRVV